MQQWEENRDSIARHNIKKSKVRNTMPYTYFYLRAALSTKGYHAVREEDRNVKKQIISK